MHIISLKRLREFWKIHPKAESPLRTWHSVVEHANFQDVNDVQAMFNSADYVPPYIVFNIGGNNFRLVVIIEFKFKKVFIKRVMTHSEYNVWSKLYQQGKA
jgi:mRNA interferase HigB